MDQTGWLQDMRDREAIKDGIYRYCWAIDRRDAEMFSTIYWPDAIDDRSPDFSGTAAETVHWMLDQVTRWERTQHTVCNTLVRVDGTRACSESQFFAYSRMLLRDQVYEEKFIGGRYIDRWEKRDGEWRILYRRAPLDWARIVPEADLSANAFRSRFAGQSLKPGDPVYEIFNLAVEPLRS